MWPPIARTIVRLACRSAEAEGLDHVPKEGAVLCVAGAARRSLDRIVLDGLSSRRLRFARDTQAADVLRDLRRGEAVCVLTEASYVLRELLRDAIAAMPDVRVVPIGLHYDDSGARRPSVWARFGAPLTLDAADDPAALIDTVRAAWRSLTLRFDDADESRLINWAAEVLATHGEMPRPLGQETPWFARHAALVERMQQHYHALKTQDAEELGALAERVDRYRRQLQGLGVSPAEVYLSMNSGRAAFFVVRELELAVIGLPLAAWGAINHVIPWWCSRKWSRTHRSDSQPISTARVCIYALAYAAQIGVAWWWLPPIGAAAYALSLPYCGCVLILYRDRLGGAWQRCRTFMRLLRERDVHTKLIEEGRALISDMLRLANQAGPSEPT